MNWVLVTGGAGGIGEALCEQLHAAGFRPIVGYCSQEEKAKKISSAVNGIPLHINLLESKSIEAAVNSIKDKNIVAVVLNASPAPVEQSWMELSTDSLENQWRISVLGNQILLRELVKHCFKAKRSGTIVGVLTKALGADRINMPGVSSYVVAKAGLRTLLQAIGAETRWLKIKTVSPDFTDTPMLSAFDPRMIELLREQGKLSKAEDVAKSILDEIVK